MTYQQENERTQNDKNNALMLKIDAEREARSQRRQAAERTHTPGPWYLTERNPNANGSEYLQIRSETYPGAVMGLSFDGSAEGLANARLIAASPELLAEHYANESILENIATRLQKDGASPAIVEVIRRRAAATRAAIAKAEGK